MKEGTSKPAILKQADNLNLSWRDERYHRFYAVVDRLVDELQDHVWAKTGKHKRRLKGDGLEKLHYSVECLVRDCMAVVLQRKRKSSIDGTNALSKWNCYNPVGFYIDYGLYHNVG